ncbi:hypothetical protein ACFE04_030714 [Oxalis oulophora]
MAEISKLTSFFKPSNATRTSLDKNNLPSEAQKMKIKLKSECEGGSINEPPKGCSPGPKQANGERRLEESYKGLKPVKNDGSGSSRRVDFKNLIHPKVSFSCMYCNKQFPTFHALGDHQNAHIQQRHQAKKHYHNVHVANGSSSFTNKTYQGSHSRSSLGVRNDSLIQKSIHNSWLASSRHHCLGPDWLSREFMREHGQPNIVNQDHQNTMLDLFKHRPQHEGIAKFEQQLMKNFQCDPMRQLHKTIPNYHNKKKILDQQYLFATQRLQLLMGHRHQKSPVLSLKLDGHQEASMFEHGIQGRSSYTTLFNVDLRNDVALPGPSSNMTPKNDIHIFNTLTSRQQQFSSRVLAGDTSTSRIGFELPNPHSNPTRKICFQSDSHLANDHFDSLEELDLTLRL